VKLDQEKVIPSPNPSKSREELREKSVDAGAEVVEEPALKSGR